MLISDSINYYELPKAAEFSWATTSSIYFILLFSVAHSSFQFFSTANKLEPSCFGQNISKLLFTHNIQYSPGLHTRHQLVLCKDITSVQLLKPQAIHCRLQVRKRLKIHNVNTELRAEPVPNLELSK